MVKLHSRETKNKAEKLDALRRQLGFQSGFWVEPIGIEGGLAIMWNNHSKAEVVKISEFLIDLKVWYDDHHDWHLMNVYMSSDEEVRRNQWVMLSHYMNQINVHKLLWGDLNDIVKA